MRRCLIVGCGGSGGATLAYMMDQLKSELAARGISAIPAGWQFVHLDVPSSPSAVGGGGVANVRAQGGTYLGIGPRMPGYDVLDSALSTQLVAGGALDAIATWAPRDPSKVSVPLSTGAGQYRALGRMITLSRVAEVRDELQRAWDRLYQTSTDSEMKSLAIPGAGDYDSNDRPIVLVVSSMAGGAGASMALDVCRVLTLVSGIDPGLMGVFMLAPDIFEGLDESAITGVRANALAMLGEIVASQTGAARPHDVELLRALGQDNGEGAVTPFARVFPVGRYVGAERTLFGDGSTDAVYRGLGCGLAALLLSGSAMQQFVEWDLTNTGGISGDVQYLGWGNEKWDNLPWSTFGFASLSMGRDRYAEYAAQRLARSSADTLLTGHKQAGSSASDEEQVNAILENQWSENIARGLGLPSGSETAGIVRWLKDTVLSDVDARRMATDVVNGVVRLPDGAGIPAAQWGGRVRQVLNGSKEYLNSGAQQAAYSVAFNWQHDFVALLERSVTDALAQNGMPLATGLVKRARRVLHDLVVSGTQELSQYTSPNLGELPEVVKPILASKGTLPNTSEIAAKVVSGTVDSVQQQVYALLAGMVSKAAAALLTEVIDPLVNALDEKQTFLRQAAVATTIASGLAHLRTDEYAAWPADRDEKVAQRFSEANNEVMLTNSAQFKQRYEEHLPKSVGVDVIDQAGQQESTRRAVAHAVTGSWHTVGGVKAPAEEKRIVERVAEWRSSAFPTDPNTRAGLIPQNARYDIHVRPAELLDRARLFINRPGEAFDQFTSVSLREFVIGSDATESERIERQRDLLLKFGEAIDLARPLASVNESAMQSIHGVAEMVYRYKFGDVPFANLQTAETLAASLKSKHRIDPKSLDRFQDALSDEAKIKRIDIFGSYPNYSPLAYNSVVEPAAKHWQALSPGQRKTFWTMRRARPLDAALPMHPNERRAMVAGWTLGRAIGFVQTTNPPFSPETPSPYVWDTDTQRWLQFPQPLLTPPTEFIADYDWLPAVLESVLIGMARSHQPPVMSSMLPYRALRRIFDESAREPARGLQVLSAKTHLTRWLRTGDSDTGVPSPISGTGQDVAIEERSRRLVAWLHEFGELAGHHYMKAGDGAGPGEPGAPGGGTFSIIATRAQAATTPIFRDVAADVLWATSQLAGLVPECADTAQRPDLEPYGDAEGKGVPPYGDSSGGTFEIPRGGVF